MDHASIYEEILKENIAALAEQRKRTFVPGTYYGGVEPSKRAAVGNQPFQRSLQGRPPQLSRITNLSSIKRVRHLSYAENASRFTGDLVE